MTDRPTQLPEPEAAVIARLIRARRIAVVGLSNDPARPSFGVARYLRRSFPSIPIIRSSWA